MSKLLTIFKSAFSDFLKDDCMSSGAAVAYYTIFSLPPLFVLIFLVAGWFGVSEQRISEAVKRQIGMPVSPQSAVPESPSQAAATGKNAGGQGEGRKDINGQQLGHVASRTSGVAQPLQALGPLAKLIGALVLVFSATGVFGQLQHSLNRAWEVSPDPKSGWKHFLLKRVLSLGMIGVIMFLLLVSLVVTTMIDEIVSFAVGGASDAVRTTTGVALNSLVTLAMATLLFAAMYKVLPDAEMRWKDLWIGAFITALLFVAGKEALGWYLQSGRVGSEWGSAAASMIALLVWVYYTSLIMLFGAELTQAWARKFGDGIKPQKGAVPSASRSPTAGQDHHAPRGA